VVVLVVGSLGAVIFGLAHIELATEDGLHSFVFGSLEKVHGPVNVAVVSHGDGFLTEGGNAIDKLFYVAGAVEKGIFGVQMEVGEFGHG
jgi:hypothetical protein